MIDIRPMTALQEADLRRLVTGYMSDARYRVTASQSAETFALRLERVALPEPYEKRYEPIDDETLAQYREALSHGFSFGAYDRESCVGLALAEPRRWNASLWVWELHVDGAFQRQGVGRRLVEALAQKARAAGLRTIVCETQNTNAPAIRFYQSTGFSIEAVDLSYYSNADYPDGEIAIFMKKRLGA